MESVQLGRNGITRRRKRYLCGSASPKGPAVRSRISSVLTLGAGGQSHPSVATPVDSDSESRSYDVPAQRAACETSPGQRAVARSHLHVLVRVHVRVKLIQGSCVFACHLSGLRLWPDCAQARCLPVGSRRKLPGRPLRVPWRSRRPRSPASRNAQDQTPKSPMPGPGHRGLFSRSRQNRDSRFPESGIPAKSGFPISRNPGFRPNRDSNPGKSRFF